MKKLASLSSLSEVSRLRSIYAKSLRTFSFASTKKLLLIFLYIFPLLSFAQVRVVNLLCENLINPIGIDATQPRFSWQLISDKRNVMQTAYEIKVTSGKSTVWSSGKVNSDSSVHVSYKGTPLQFLMRKRCNRINLN